MKTEHRASQVAFAATLALAASLVVAPPSRAEPPAAPIAPKVPRTICADGLSPITDQACFAAPLSFQDASSAKAPLLLYLHGLFQPDMMAEELARQSRVAKHATARGYAVLALYGKLGVCDTRGDHLGWICWPSNEQVAGRSAEIVASWKEPLAQARQRAGHGKTFVLGFSNGAYFAGLLAVRDLFPANAFAIAQGGPVEPVHATGKRAPILLLSTDEESPIVHAEMDRFGSELAADGWSFVQEERTGGHELNDQDVDAALDFFDEPSHDALH